MGMTIDTIIKDCEQGIKQCELFIKVHQKNMEIGEIKEYQYYIERDELTIDIMQKYQKIQAIAEKCNLKLLPKEAMNTFMKDVFEVLEDGKTD